MNDLITGLSIVVGLFLSGFANAAGNWFFQEHGKRHAQKIIEAVKVQREQFKNSFNGGLP